MKDTAFYLKKTLNLGGKIMDLSTPKVMGILNVTPDSFFDGGRFTTEKAWVDRAVKMTEEGAAIIDIGGYSTRPGADDISQEEEINRVVPAIKAIKRELPDAIISIDTFRSEVARRAVGEGAALINDVSGGQLDPEMFSVVSKLKVPYILMHMKGTPQTMNSLTDYKDLIGEMIDYFVNKSEILRNQGITDIIIDPGFGFSKTVDQNFGLMQKLNYFKTLKMPILVGVSRKSMIHKRLEVKPQDTLNGTTVLNTIALTQGADLLRVHDVKECVEAVKLYQSVYFGY